MIDIANLITLKGPVSQCLVQSQHRVSEENGREIVLGISRYSNPLRPRRESALSRYYEWKNGKMKKETESVSIRSIRPTGLNRSCYSCVRLLHLFAFFGKMKCIPVGTRRTFFLSFSLRPSFPRVSQYYRDSWNELYICLRLLWNSHGGIFADRGKSHQREMQLTKSDANKGIRFCSLNGWVIYYERAKLSTKLYWNEYSSTRYLFKFLNDVFVL